MKKLLSIVTIIVFIAGYSVSAFAALKADNMVDQSKAIVSYDLKTNEGVDLVLTADYSFARPIPDLENMDIAPKDPIRDGTRTFTLRSKEGTPVTIEYTYKNGERVGMKISSQPSNPASDAEYSQILSVESKAGYSISFTFIWQGSDLKEVRIEPSVNPFASNG